MVPTSSMEKTLLPGDFILVNKIAYGPRTAQTPLSFPFSHQYFPFNKNLKAFVEWIKLPYFRIPGLESIHYNDVVVFNYPLDDDFPVDHKTYYVKRCVALPGDTLLIEDAQVMINNKKEFGKRLFFEQLNTLDGVAELMRSLWRTIDYR